MSASTAPQGSSASCHDPAGGMDVNEAKQCERVGIHVEFHRE